MENVKSTEERPPEELGTAKVKSTAAKKHKSGGQKARETAQRKAAVAALATEEGKAVLQAALADIVAELKGNLTAAREDAGTAPKASDLSIIESLAQTLVEMSDQGSNRAPKLTPAQKAEREAARDEMQALIVEAVAKDLPATYELTRPVYFAEQLIEPTYRDVNRAMRQTVIDWAGIPDESMVPKNETAEKIKAAFMRSIGGRTKEAKVPYSRTNPVLRIHGRETATPVTQPRHDPDNSGLKVHRPNAPGQIEQIHVLGTARPPSRTISA